jgi:hypothetical protein
MLECPLYNSIRGKFEDVVLRSLKPLFQLDHKSMLASILLEANAFRH